MRVMFFIAAAVLFACLCASAEQVTIDGTVQTNCGSGNEGVSGVDVTLTSDSVLLDTQVSDSKGYFAFEDVAFGAQVQVGVASTSEFQPVSPVTLTASANITLSFELTATVSMAAPSDITFECPSNTDPYNTGVPAVNSYCPVSLVFTDTLSGSQCDEIVTRTWTATASNGNSVSAVQRITTVDTTAPALTVPADAVLDCTSSSSPSNTGSASAYDACSTATVSFSDAVTGACPEVIYRTWAAADMCGNFATAVQVITMVDTSSPVFSVSPSAYNGTCSDASEEWYDSFAYAVVSDDCSPVSVSMTLEGSCSGTAVVTAVDECGNTATATTTFSTQSDDPSDPDNCSSCWF